MRKSKFFFTIATAALLLSNGAFLNAQVTVGDDKTPETYSLLELVSNQHNGLRLPQIPTTAAKNAISATYGTNPEMMGLTIFNMETHCVETWNGNVWIAACGKVAPSPLSTELSTNRVTAFVDAMYDFQHQTLTAYLTAGTPTAFQWEMSTDGGTTWMNIVGATSADYIVPADFMYDYAYMDKNDKTPGILDSGIDNSSIEVFFRCLITDNSGITGHTPVGNVLQMLFIRTNTDGYGIDNNGIYYLTIKTRNTHFPSGTMKIALLNLGQSEDNGIYNDNADDLGDFYQWGRVKDGHEHIVWSKRTDVPANNVNYMVNIIDPQTGNGATSIAISGTATAANLDGNGQIKDDGNDYYGKFITPSTYWAYGNPNNLWGNGGANTRTGSDIPLSSPPPPPTTPPTSLWTYQANNPCPDNWSVPSNWIFFDICNGDGSTPSTLPTTSINWSGGVIKGVNTWQWRGTTNNAIGGVIITNADGEKVFLPAAGSRYYSNALLNSLGTVGCYWSSSVNGGIAYSLVFTIDNVSPGNYNNSRALGFSVRCVSN